MDLRVLLYIVLALAGGGGLGSFATGHGQGEQVRAAKIELKTELATAKAEILGKLEVLQTENRGLAKLVGSNEKRLAGIESRLHEHEKAGPHPQAEIRIGALEKVVEELRRARDGPR